MGFQAKLLIPALHIQTDYSGNLLEVWEWRGDLNLLLRSPQEPQPKQQKDNYTQGLRAEK